MFLLVNFPKWLILIALCAGIYMRLCLKSLKTRYAAPFITLVSINMLYLSNLEPGYYVTNHGSMNGNYLIRIVTIYWVVYCIIKVISGPHSTLTMRVWVASFFVLLSMIVYYIYFAHNSAKGWQNGLGEKSLIHDGAHCTVPTPTY